MAKYPDTFPLWVLQKAAATPCRNPEHGTAVEFNDRAICGAGTTILCADCCVEIAGSGLDAFLRKQK